MLPDNWLLVKQCEPMSHFICFQRTVLKLRFMFNPLHGAVIRAPGMEPLKIPLSVECATINDVSVWEWAGSAYDEGPEAAEWVFHFFGVPNSTGAL